MKLKILIACMLCLCFVLFCASCQFKLRGRDDGGSSSLAGGSADVKPEGEVAGKYYTVSFSTGCDFTIDPIKAGDRQTISAPESPQREGYLFDGWYYGDEKWVFSAYIVTKDITLRGKWTPLMNTLSFEGGSATGGSMRDLHVGSGEKINLPQIGYEKTGYSFVGWAVTEGGEAIYPDGAEFTMGIEEFYTLYAVWELSENSVVFDANGAQGSMDELVLLTGATGNLPFNTYVKDGYSFLGWATSKDGEVEYLDGGEYAMGTDKINVLYAVWLGHENVLTFDGMGAQGSMDGMVIRSGETVNLRNNTFVYEGFKFLGWSTTVGGEVEYLDGAEFTMGADPSFTLYAVWDVDDNHLVFDGNGATGGSTDGMSMKGGTSANLTENGFVRYGYTFLGWSTTENGEVEYLDGAEYTMGNERVYTLYAVWEINVYNITYELNGGTEKTKNPTTFTVEDLPLKLYDLEDKDNALFSLWYKESDFSGAAVVEITEIGDLELYAHFVEGTKGLTFGDTDDGFAVTGYNGTLAEVVIPREYKGKRVTVIGENAFYGCTTLKSITVPDTVKIMKSRAFRDCTYLERVNITDIKAWCEIELDSAMDNPLYNARKLYLNGTEITELIIPDDVTVIKNYVFYNCKYFKSIYVGNGTLSIGSYAFYNCGAQSLTVGNNVKSIGGSAFASCTSLISVVLGENVTEIGDNAFNNCISLAEINVPDSLETIGFYAFRNCKALKGIDFGSGVINIYAYAFSNCTGLESITIPDKVKSIGDETFYGCTGLKNVTLGNGVTSIGQSAFANCTSLESIVIGSKVTSIGAYAFSGCTSLTVYCEAQRQPSGWNSKWNNSSCPVEWGYTKEA